MFLLTMFLLSIPKRIVVFLGEPFKFTMESSSSSISEHRIRERYYNARWEHHAPRALALVITIIVCSGLLFWPGLTWIITFLLCILIISGIVDVIMGFSRWVYFKDQQQKRAKPGNKLPALVGNEWKDSSLKAILEKREQEMAEQCKANEIRKSEFKQARDREIIKAAEEEFFGPL